MRNKISLSVLLLALGFVGCTESSQRSIKSTVSDWTGGLNRTVTVYSYDGNPIKSWTGKFDVQPRENSILFDKDGKRVIIYGGIIINEEN